MQRLNLNRNIKFVILGVLLLITAVIMFYTIWKETNGRETQQQVLIHDITVGETNVPKPKGIISDVTYKNKSLRVLADEAVENIDINKIERLVDQYLSGNKSNRAIAIKELEAETGLGHIYTLSKEDQAVGFENNKWRAYSQKLEIAINEKIPRILRPITKPEHKSIKAWAAQYLGEEAPHKAFLPLLRKIATDSEEDEYVRIKALKSLARIPHDGMIEFLIELLDDEVVAYHSWRCLSQLARVQAEDIVAIEDFYKDEDTGGHNFKAIKAGFTQWWETHKKEFKYERARMMWSN